MDYINLLNENQYLAVTTDKQHVRVVAGAGSGKTRVLTYRIAYLMEYFYVRSWEILAITFTNKVANEMKNRVAELVPNSTRDLTIKTFHSFAAMFLRREIENIGFPRTFTILDEEDQTKLIKDIASEMNYKRTDPIVKKAIGYIGKMKLQEKLPEDISRDKLHYEDERTCLDIYERYEEEKNKMYALDFDDLLLKANYILSNFDEIRLKWATKYKHILVDEFQDTNDVEFKLLKLLMFNDTSLYVVGDPDQTIYTWRGANQDIILQLKKRYPLLEDIVLNRNYRSTQTILNAANKLISHNKMRLEKDLYTENNVGSPIIIRSCPTGRSEAEYIARTIKMVKDIEHKNYRDMVILYRSNYITQEFEQALTKLHIPYKIYGGLKFYQRKEIKDVLAYFRLINNPKDDISFERIINVPRRGIGDTTLNLIKSEAKNLNLSIYEFISSIEPSDSYVSKKALNTLKSMIYRIEKTKADVTANDELFSKHLEDLIIDIGYYDYLKDDEEGDERLENVKALFDDIRHFIKSNPESTFDEYLQNIALISAQDDIVDGDYVTLMTVHTAKGLEYPVVFLVRLNQSVFPNARAISESGYKGLEEERRLAYVAITRAKERLYISCTNDYSYVTKDTQTPSSFISEAGLTLPLEKKSVTTISQNRNNVPPRREPISANVLFDDLQYEPKPKLSDILKTPKTNNVDSWSVGDICIHKKFGEGEVISVDEDNIIEVRFKDEGVKTLMGNHPSLTKGGNKA